AEARADAIEVVIARLQSHMVDHRALPEINLDPLHGALLISNGTMIAKVRLGIPLPFGRCAGDAHIERAKRFASLDLQRRLELLHGVGDLALTLLAIAEALIR